MSALPAGKGDSSGRVEPASYEAEILQSLRQISRALDIGSRQLNAGYEITSPQLVCLHSLAEPGEHTATSLSKRVHLSPSTIVGIIDRLEQKSLVVRNRDTRDRRVVYVSVTPKGRKLVSSVPGPLQKNLAAGLRGLTREQRAAIAQSLKTIANLMNAVES